MKNNIFSILLLICFMNYAAKELGKADRTLIRDNKSVQTLFAEKGFLVHDKHGLMEKQFRLQFKMYHYHNCFILSFKTDTMPAAKEKSNKEESASKETSLEELIKRSGILSNPNLPGINYSKQQKIISYMNGKIKSGGLNAANVQLLVRDMGDDLRITIFYYDSIYLQTNYSKIQKP